MASRVALNTTHLAPITVKRAARYASAIAFTALAYLVRVQLETRVTGSPVYLPFTLAVVCATSVSGFGPGVLTTALSLLTALYFFIPPDDALIVTSAAELTRVISFLATATAIIAFSYVRDAALRRARASEAALQGVNDHLEQQVAHRTAELTRTNAELEARNAEQETFIYTVSHDLRAPLLSMSGLAEALEEAVRDGDEDSAEYLTRRLRANVTKMDCLLNDLLTLSRAGRQTDDIETFPLGDAVDAALADLTPNITRREVTVDAPADWPVIAFTRNDAYQVVLNLVGNAVKYAGTSDRPAIVRLSTRRTAAGIHFRVEDNGPGIEARYRDKVFGLFQRLNPKEEGTGVGLAIVKRVVERHGGRVWIEDSPLGGAAFVVALPA